MKTQCLALVFLCMWLFTHAADATVGESSVFALDTRDSFRQLAAESGVFAFDTRLVDGLDDDGNSAGFVLDTRTTLTGGLQIVGPSSVSSGGQVSYVIQNAVVDVSLQSTLIFNHAPVAYAGIGGHALFTYPVTVPQTVQLIARYNAPGGQIQSAPFNVTILPDPQKILLSATVTANSQGSGTFHVVFSAAATGGQAPYTYLWDTDADGQFDDLTAAGGNFSLASAGATLRLGVQAQDANGATATAYKLVPLVRPPVLNEPETSKMPTLGQGQLLNFGTLSPAVPDAVKAQKGLVIVTHGIRSSEADKDSKGRVWPQWMAASIASRIPNAEEPNIMVYSWKDGADPAEYPAEAVNNAKLGLEAMNLVLKLSGTPVEIPATKLLVDSTEAVSNLMIDAWFARNQMAPIHGQELATYLWLLSRENPPRVVPGQPIHLIGHSAGGFVMGECAQLLKQRGIIVDQVTMLDTPYPIYEHLRPNQGQTPRRSARRIERYVSSFYGLLAQLPIFALPQGLDYYFEATNLAPSLRFTFGSHGYAHEWYTDETISNTSSKTGFFFSPFCPNGGYPYATGSSGAIAALSKETAIAATQSFFASEMETTASEGGFQSFGSVNETGGVYTLTEVSHAGIFKDVTLPIGSQSMRFAAWFASPGDGDRLEVHFNGAQALYTVMDLPITREGFLTFNAPVDWLQGQTGQMVFKLVSVGSANAVVQIKDIEIVSSDDPDEDGLTTTQEQTAGTNPLLFDTDGDGLSDLSEMQVHLTNPLLFDTDSDGISDNHELTAGTDPTNGQSFFRVTDAARNTSGTMLLRWPSQAGRYYNVQRSMDVTFGTYEVLSQGQAATPPLNTFVDNAAGASPAGRYFYRIQVYQP